MTEERLQSYCAQRGVAYITPTKTEGVDKAAARRAFLTSKLTARQQRRLRRRGPSWRIA